MTIRTTSIKMSAYSISPCPSLPDICIPPITSFWHSNKIIIAFWEGFELMILKGFYGNRN